MSKENIDSLKAILKSKKKRKLNKPIYAKRIPTSLRTLI